MTEVVYADSNVVVEQVPMARDNPTPIVEVLADNGKEAPGTEDAVSIEPATPPEKTPEQLEQEKFASRFAALSKKERDLLQRERSFKENQAKMAAYETAVQKAKENPLAYLQAAGLTLEQALQQIINEGNPPTEVDRVASIEKKIADYEAAQEQLARRNAEYNKQQQLGKIHSQINMFVESNADQFELIREYKAIDTVWQVIERTYMETGGKVHLTQEQACQAVEDQLYEEAKQEAERHARIKKLTKQNSLTSVSHVEDSNPRSVSKTVSPTLTNGTAVADSAPPKRFKTTEESLAAAAKLLKWKE